MRYYKNLKFYALSFRCQPLSGFLFEPGTNSRPFSQSRDRVGAGEGWQMTPEATPIPYLLHLGRGSKALPDHCYLIAFEHMRRIRYSFLHVTTGK